MKKTISSFSLALVLTLAVAAPIAASADVSNTGPAGGSVSNTGPATPATPVGQQTGAQTVSGGLQNPLGGVTSLTGFFYKIVNLLYSLSYAVIAVFLIISGFKFVKAQGNPEEISDAKKTFEYTIIGAILLIGANVITAVVQNLISQFK